MLDRGCLKHPQTWPGAFDVEYIKDNPYPYHYNCPAPLCFYSVMVATEEKRDEMAANHPCPWYSGGHTTLSWNVMSDEYLQPIWRMLDEQVNIIKGPPPGVEESLQARAKARAFSEALALLMQPFFTEADAVAREALKRWEAHQRNEEPQTPGLGRLKWKRPGGVLGDPSHPSWVTKEYDPNYAHHDLSGEQVAEIKAAKAMPVAMLAQAYEVSQRVIESIQKEG